MTSTDDAVAAFLARGGAIKRIAEGERTMTEREMYLARRGVKPAPAREGDYLWEMGFAAEARAQARGE